MSVVAPAGARSRIEEGPEGLSVTIPAARSPFHVLMFAAMAFLMLMLTVSSLRIGTMWLGLESLLWLAIQAALVGLFQCLWVMAGRERIVLTPRLLVYRREILGFAMSREYATADLRNLRVMPPSGHPSQPFLPGSGMVAFDYGSRTVRFGASVDEPEAAMIVERMTGPLSLGSAG